MTDTPEPNNAPAETDYEVGYGRPPKETQFKPGRSGNPKGRKRKRPSVRTQMQTVLSRKISVTEGGRTKKLPLQEVILRSIATKAAKGDLKAASFAFNLLNSPEHADTDTIEQDNLSPDDQAMLEEMISQLTGASNPEPSSRSGPIDEEASGGEPSRRDAKGVSQHQDRFDRDERHDDRTKN